MYEQFFGLTRSPFLMTADPSFLYLTPAHREALAGLAFVTLNRKGLAVLIGDAGTGKSTLLQTAIDSTPSSRAVFSVILNPCLSPAEFLEAVLLGFGISDVTQSKPRRLTQLTGFLREMDAQGKAAVLVIDEAHSLSAEVLEEVRLLTNIETPAAKLLQIILAAQSELCDVLNRWWLRQLKQRIAYRLILRPLAPEEVPAYVKHRWRKAGGTEVPLAEDVLDYLSVFSGGIPRVINAICDNALLLAFSERRATVLPEDIVVTAKELVAGDSQARNAAAEALSRRSELPARGALRRIGRDLGTRCPERIRLGDSRN